jgi:putative drug exporter of the RND superfamily
MGRWNWWAPKWLAWLHERFGISEGQAAQVHELPKFSQTASAPAMQLQEG